MASASDQLIHTTVRIETSSPNGGGRGSGFFFHFCDDGVGNVPAIITNKHVIAGAGNGVIHITERKSDNSGPDLGKFNSVNFTNFEQLWIKHPDADVDLAALPLTPLLQQLSKRGHKPHYTPLGMDLVADDAYLNSLSAVEDIVMAGYPTGLWDSKHNLPIIRRGITATPPYVDFDGKPWFMIDCACFPGSSGSPVLLYNLGMHIDKKGGTNLGGTRVKLLGVLFAGPQFTATGKISVEPVPTSVNATVQSPIPTNLGVCVKARELDWFEQHFAALVAKEKAAKT